MKIRWVLEERRTTGPSRRWRETSILGVKNEAHARKLFKNIIATQEPGWRSRLVKVYEAREVIETEKYS